MLSAEKREKTAKNRARKIDPMTASTSWMHPAVSFLPNWKALTTGFSFAMGREKRKYSAKTLNTLYANGKKEFLATDTLR
jgi:hypothetical protein